MLVGEKFNHLLIVKQVESKNGKRFLCKCDCGNELIVYGFRLKSGHTKSCGCLRNKPLSPERKIKISNALNGNFYFDCDICGRKVHERESHYKKSIRHFCSLKCRSVYVKSLPFYKQNSYKGVRKIGESANVYHKHYRKRYPEKIAKLKARRYLREKNAEGSHTEKEWEELKEKYNFKCVICGESNDLTKDHIQPLSKGGSNYIDNIQPLCRSCNSKKNDKYNPELLEG